MFIVFLSLLLFSSIFDQMFDVRKGSMRGLAFRVSGVCFVDGLIRIRGLSSRIATQTRRAFPNSQRKDVGSGLRELAGTRRWRTSNAARQEGIPHRSRNAAG